MRLRVGWGRGEAASQGGRKWERAGSLSPGDQDDGSSEVGTLDQSGLRRGVLQGLKNPKTHSLSYLKCCLIAVLASEQVQNLSRVRSKVGGLLSCF